MAKSDRKIVGELMTTFNVPQLRKLASKNGVIRQRGDSKRQTAWRIVKQDRGAAKEALKKGRV